jgi:hypothetical protein
MPIAKLSELLARKGDKLASSASALLAITVRLRRSSMLIGSALWEAPPRRANAI